MFNARKSHEDNTQIPAADGHQAADVNTGLPDENNLVSEVPSQIIQVATSSFPLRDVHGEIFSARKTARGGEN